jgi:hypothetical protein
LRHKVDVASRWAPVLSVNWFRPRSAGPNRNANRLAVKHGGGLTEPGRQTRAIRVLMPLYMTVIGAGVLGCGSTGVSLLSAGASPGAALSPAEVVLEIKAESKSLRLAPGWTWPIDEMPQSQGPDGRPVVYQVGYGTTWADHYWYCSWEWRLVNGGLNPAERDQTLEMLASVRSREYYIVAVDAIDKVKFDKELNEAISGSLKSMQTDVALNCPPPPS